MMLPEVWQVVWKDAGVTQDGWTSKEDVKCEPVMVTSVGYLVKETTDGLVLAMDATDDESFCGCSFIPKAIVHSRTHLVPIAAAVPSAQAL